MLTAWLKVTLLKTTDMYTCVKGLGFWKREHWPWKPLTPEARTILRELKADI